MIQFRFEGLFSQALNEPPLTDTNLVAGIYGASGGEAMGWGGRGSKGEQQQGEESDPNHVEEVPVDGAQVYGGLEVATDAATPGAGKQPPRGSIPPSTWAAWMPIMAKLMP